MSEVQILVVVTGRETPPGWHERIIGIVQRALVHALGINNVTVARFYPDKPTNKEQK